ncbi:MAG: Fe-S cluster assembly ATPase SufC [Candidatus Micrarchaeia archaeon]
MMMVEIKDLHASVNGKEIIKGLNLSVRSGEIHAIMGPNGSGKTTFANAIMGHPKITIESGQILIDGKDANGMKTDERVKLGIFMQFQNPVEVEGVGLIQFLRTAKESITGSKINFKEFMDDIKESMKKLEMSDDFIKRSLNVGFSGGEKKKSEILQLMVLKPSIAILDEPDSGLDVDALKVVANNIQEIAKQNNMGVIIITHYSRILSYIRPDSVHVMIDGRIVANGDYELVKKIEKDGYESLQEKSK